MTVIWLNIWWESCCVDRVFLVSSPWNIHGSTINHCCVGTTEHTIILQLVAIVKTFVVDDLICDYCLFSTFKTHNHLQMSCPQAMWGNGSNTCLTKVILQLSKIMPVPTSEWTGILSRCKNTTSPSMCNVDRLELPAGVMHLTTQTAGKCETSGKGRWLQRGHHLGCPLSKGGGITWLLTIWPWEGGGSTNSKI